LEIGLETLDEGSQDLINKQQSLGLFRDFLDASAAAGVAVVINYMTGLPGADPGEEQRWLEVVRAEVSARPSLQAVVEHNVFQLEMLSPMGRDPRRYGIEVVSQWPWSSLMEFRLETAGFALAS
jgi:radical SAM superfamily enzyme